MRGAESQTRSRRTLSAGPPFFAWGGARPRGTRSPRAAQRGGRRAQRGCGGACTAVGLGAALVRAGGAAGAGVRGGLRVDALPGSGACGGGVVGRGENGAETLRARLVLAADGTRSVAARRLRLSREPPPERRFGLVA